MSVKWWQVSRIAVAVICYYIMEYLLNTVLVEKNQNLYEHCKIEILLI